MIVGENSRVRRHGRQHHQGEEAHQHALVRRATSSSGSSRRAGCRLEQALEFCREDECVEVTPRRRPHPQGGPEHQRAGPHVGTGQDGGQVLLLTLSAPPATALTTPRGPCRPLVGGGLSRPRGQPLRSRSGDIGLPGPIMRTCWSMVSPFKSWQSAVHPPARKPARHCTSKVEMRFVSHDDGSWSARGTTRRPRRPVGHGRCGGDQGPHPLADRRLPAQARQGHAWSPASSRACSCWRRCSPRCWTRWGSSTPTVTNPKLVTGVGSLPTGPLGGMSLDHWLGVEPGTGRDLFSRILAGLTLSLTVAVLATIISVLVGTVLGLISGFAGGWVDWGVSRVMDLLLASPSSSCCSPCRPSCWTRCTTCCTYQPDAPSSIAFLVLFLSASSAGRSSPASSAARCSRCASASSSRRRSPSGRQRSRIYFKEMLPAPVGADPRLLHADPAAEHRGRGRPQLPGCRHQAARPRPSARSWVTPSTYCRCRPGVLHLPGSDVDHPRAGLQPPR